MQATAQANEKLQSTRVEAARLLIEANEIYRASNRPGASHQQRSEDRGVAKALIEQALALDPAHASALGLLGRIELDEGQLNEARRFFNQALAQERNAPQLIANLGYLNLMENQPAQAQQYFQQALQQDKSYAAAFLGIAHCQAAMGNYDIAYMHYRRLLEYGLEWPTLYAGMIKCCAHLQVGRRSETIERDLTDLLQQEDLPHQNLARLTAQALALKYDLRNPDVCIDINDAAQDPLLLLALTRTVMPNADVEQFITLIRKAILEETTASGELREGLQELAIAVGVYNVATGGALYAAEDETAQISDLNRKILLSCTTENSVTDIAGAVIVAAMYVTLFPQAYSRYLSAFSLGDWPDAMQTLMEASFYLPMEDEGYKQGFQEKQLELLEDAAEVAMACPVWRNIEFFSEQSLRKQLESVLGAKAQQLPERLCAMILGAESSQRAVEFARYFDDVDVIAVDENLANLAFGARKAEQYDLENIVFWPYSIAQRFIEDGARIHFLKIEKFPSLSVAEFNLIESIQKMVCKGGVVQVSTGDSELTQVTDKAQTIIEHYRLTRRSNDIRLLRRAIIENADDPAWAPLLSHPHFYNLTGCRSTWFAGEDRAQIQSVLTYLSNEVDWKLAQVKDRDDKVQPSGPILKQLQTEVFGADIGKVIGHDLKLYFVKR
ncbi:FOG: TPR repeat [Hahella chejuensis KCTC 2396]|uniref:FOG: TPR repeat n=1 Tax=Hahella chejuensis (strain KCTC 2396) TaxID=349521 RepID=Q2SCV7_HAHCH|nr:tetratricopeptide repeat protein [Hahella chejuensis]ABC31517.1 FOG: TPR repeat [Hahella chejuensis KCTC 2396]